MQSFPALEAPRVVPRTVLSMAQAVASALIASGVRQHALSLAREQPLALVAQALADRFAGSLRATPVHEHLRQLTGTVRPFVAVDAEAEQDSLARTGSGTAPRTADTARSSRSPRRTRDEGSRSARPRRDRNSPSTTAMSAGHAGIAAAPGDADGLGTDVPFARRMRPRTPREVARDPAMAGARTRPPRAGHSQAGERSTDHPPRIAVRGLPPEVFGDRATRPY